MRGAFQRRLSWLFCVLAIFGSADAAIAGATTYEPTQPPYLVPMEPGAHGFYIEFCGRSETDGFGHAYIVLGAIDRSGRRRRTAVFGFVPRTADDELWSQFAIPVSGMIGVSRSDFMADPDVRYRLPLRRADYNAILRNLAGLQEQWTIYALIGQNCNDLVGAIARSIGLEAPIFAAQLPTSYVAELRAINAH